MHRARLCAGALSEGMRPWQLWYNRTRPHSTLAYVSPMQFEQDGLATQAKLFNL
jgi:hypothetical protein